VWPGAAVFPDWFHSNTQKYWNDEFSSFFDANSGVDIDALWIDMNEPSNFCEYPCSNPDAQTSQDAKGLQSRHASPEPSLGSERAHSESRMASVQDMKKTRRTAASGKVQAREVAERQASGNKKGLPGRDLINPSYKIHNEQGSISNKTADTDLIHQGGWAEYDTHNL
jgi:alpha-glucosidase